MMRLPLTLSATLAIAASARAEIVGPVCSVPDTGAPPLAPETCPTCAIEQAKVDTCAPALAGFFGIIETVCNGDPANCPDFPQTLEAMGESGVASLYGGSCLSCFDYSDDVNGDPSTPLVKFLRVSSCLGAQASGAPQLPPGCSELISTAQTCENGPPVCAGCINDFSFSPLGQQNFGLCIQPRLEELAAQGNGGNDGPPQGPDAGDGPRTGPATNPLAAITWLDGTIPGWAIPHWNIPQMVTIGQWYMDAGAEAIGAGSARDLEVTLEQFSTIWIDNLNIEPYCGFDNPYYIKFADKNNDGKIKMSEFYDVTHGLRHVGPLNPNEYPTDLPNCNGAGCWCTPGQGPCEDGGPNFPYNGLTQAECSAIPGAPGFGTRSDIWLIANGCIAEKAGAGGPQFEGVKYCKDAEDGSGNAGEDATRPTCSLCSKDADEDGDGDGDGTTTDITATTAAPSDESAAVDTAVGVAVAGAAGLVAVLF